MKTTLDIQASLLSRAKVTAAQERITLTRMVEEGLRLRLQRGRSARATFRPPRLPVSKQPGGLRLGIDPRSNQSLYDALDA